MFKNLREVAFYDPIKATNTIYFMFSTMNSYTSRYMTTSE